MRILLILLFLKFVNLEGAAQQRPQHTQFMLNKYNENPAYGGLDRSLSVYAMYRDQYTALNGSPKNMSAGGHIPFYLWNGALGFQIFNQSAGVMNHSGLNISYNYVLGTDFGLLSVGGRVGGEFISINGSGILTPDGIYDDGFDHNDPILDESTFSGIGLSYQAGVYFYSEEIEAGVSLGELPGFSANVDPAVYSKSAFANLFFEYKYRLDATKSLSAGLLLKADRAVIQTDLYALYKIRGGVFGGLSLRGYNRGSLDAVNIIIGSKINDHFSLSYSHDIGISGLRNVNDGSHEILLTYNLNKLIGIGLSPKVIYNPRYL